jgi:adenylate cyclase
MGHRLAAILVADVAGFAARMRRDEAATLARLKACEAEVIEPLVAAKAGRIVKRMGDGYLIELPSAISAVECAVAWQEALAARGSGAADSQELVFRVGINVGDVVVDGDDIFGDGVNVAARLESLAEPGAIWVSDQVYRLTSAHVGVAFEDLGEQAVKGLPTPVHAYRVVGPSALAGPSPPAAERRAAARPSIVVLPFHNARGNPDDDYFVDGITEDITSALSRFEWLLVIARQSAFAYRNGPLDLARIGRELRVRYALTGTVRFGGHRVRVAAQLIEVETGRQAWADRYDGELGDIFALQDQFTADIVTVLGPEIAHAEIERARRQRAESVDVWDLYLRARALYWRMEPDKNAEAIRLLERCVELEPEFALGHAALSICLSFAAYRGWAKPGRVAWEGSRQSAERAIRIDSNSPEAHYAAALALVYSGEQQRGANAARRALELNPNMAEARAVLGMAFAFMGEWREALTAIEAARCISPHSQGFYMFVAVPTVAYFAAGELESCLGWAQRYAAEWPQVYSGYVFQAAANALLGHDGVARLAIENAMRCNTRLCLGRVRKNPMFTRAVDIERLIEGLRLAGLPETRTDQG